MIRLRFVSYRDIAGDLISAYSGSPWDHVEAVMPDGSGYLGAVDDGKGVAVRPIGYDKPFVKERFVDLPASDDVTAAFYQCLRQHLGEPYDFEAIAGYAIHDDGLHQKGRVICSALQTIAAVKSGWFPGSLTRKPHEVDPADLLFVLSGRVAINNAA
jgi:hypothetical protein